MLGCCWKCGCKHHQFLFFCLNCGKVQKINISGSPRLNLFEIFGIKSEFSIDIKELEHSFKSIQLKLHPDQFANCTTVEQEASLISSSSVNQAYQILKNPLSRAEYLLKFLFDEEIFDGKSNEPTDNDLMTEVFDIREAICDSTDAIELRTLRKQLVTQLDELQQHFTKSITTVDGREAKFLAIRLKYYFKILDELNEKLEKLECI